MFPLLLTATFVALRSEQPGPWSSWPPTQATPNTNAACRSDTASSGISRSRSGAGTTAHQHHRTTLTIVDRPVTGQTSGLSRSVRMQSRSCSTISMLRQVRP